MHNMLLLTSVYQISTQGLLVIKKNQSGYCPEKSLKNKKIYARKKITNFPTFFKWELKRNY